MDWLKKLLGGNKKNDPIWVLTNELLTYRAHFQKFDITAHKLRLTSDIREEQLNAVKQYLKSLMDDLALVVLVITQSGGRPLLLGDISYKLRQVVENHSHSSDIQDIQDVLEFRVHFSPDLTRLGNCR